MNINQYECVLKKIGEFEYDGPARISDEKDLFHILDAYGLRENAEEHFILITMDSALEITGIFEIAKGKPDQMVLDTRELFKRACLMNCTIMAVAHNHPHIGKAKPSPEDISLTNKIMFGCDAMGITFIDHIIMTLDDEMSMKCEHYLE